MEEKRSEEDWENIFRLNDKFSERYFQLLQRFGDLPACDDLIVRQLRGEFPPEFIEELNAYQERMPPHEPEEFDEPPRHEPWNQNPGGLEDEGAPKDKLLESVDVRARNIAAVFYQSIFDWCNLYAVLLAPEQRRDGLVILFYLGRALGYLNSGMEELVSWQFASSLAMSKRCLQCVSLLLGQLRYIADNDSRLGPLAQDRIKHFMQVVDSLHEHISACRQLSQEGESF